MVSVRVRWVRYVRTRHNLYALLVRAVVLLVLFIPEYRILGVVGFLPASSTLIVVLFWFFFITNIFLSKFIANRLGFRFHVQVVNTQKDGTYDLQR